MSNSIDLYLASSSPRRRQLLAQIGVRFETVAIDVEEVPKPNEPPMDYVHRLAHTKAKAGANLKPDKPVLGADTIVVLGDKILEKPKTAEEGVNMLQSLSAQTHKVITAVCVSFKGQDQLRFNATHVRFRPIQISEAQKYWRTGEPLDKAGGYGIQGLGAVFVESINGSYSSVVGLPILETTQLLRAYQVPFWQVEPVK